VAGPATAGSVRDALVAATDALRAVGIGEARLDAEVLLEHATGWDRARLAADPELKLPPAEARRFGEMVRRRLRREPVAYIVGSKWFRNIELAVDPRVLIPRPETEMLVDLALELRPASALDVGTGSGAIALAIAEELPGCELVATDTSSGALAVAGANAERLGLAERVRFLEGTVPEGEFDLVVANLPYVPESDWDSLQPEVTEWEPRQALLSGPDGLDAIRAVLPDCVRCLSRPAATDRGNAGGALALEVGMGQAGKVEELMREAGLVAVGARPDLAGVPRIVVGRRQGAP
jgi:release factor glutamine methyltransferase